MHGVTTRWPKALDDVENAYQQLDEAALLAYPTGCPDGDRRTSSARHLQVIGPPSDDRLGTS
jgi:hypothetical protein